MRAYGFKLHEPSAVGASTASTQRAGFNPVVLGQRVIAHTAMCYDVLCSGLVIILCSKHLKSLLLVIVDIEIHIGNIAINGLAERVFNVFGYYLFHARRA